MRMQTLVLSSWLAAASLAMAAAASLATAAGEEILLPRDAWWRWLPGTAAYPEGWREPAFDDSSWAEGQAGFGYGDGDDRTVLADMRGRYLSVALRTSFTVRRPRELAPLELLVDHDDGFVAWLNGVEIARSHLEGSPPAHDQRARDHEAGHPRSFPVPSALLVPGRNVLAVQVANASLHSSDLSLWAELRASRLGTPSGLSERDEEPAPPEPIVPAKEGAVRGAFNRTAVITLGTGHDSNYFQSRAGSPKESVLIGTLRGSLQWERRRDSTLRLRVQAETERFEGLGQTKGLSFRLLHRRGRSTLDADLRARLDRPAFKLGGRLARSDTLRLGLAWGLATGSGSALELGASWLVESNDLDPLRENDQWAFGAALRLWPDSRVLSPEVGLERGGLDARETSFSYRQWRPQLRLVSKPTRSTYLSLLVRRTERSYSTDDAAAGNFGRRDEKWVSRGLLAWRAGPRLGLTSWLSWEEGRSSRPNRGYETWIAWAGLNLYF